MWSAIALPVVLLAGGYLVGLGVLAAVAPAKATGYLHAFATTPLKHYAELAVRLVVGAAFVLRAPHMLLAEVFSLFGWTLIITTACLLAMPWRWHRQFAQQAVPRATRHLGLLATASLAAGTLVLAAALLGSATAL